ncbi:MAG: hypothetical protein PHW52_02325 [Candidatus Pacebacteria bacterium]|nr:hypothetical protein [Candidatus Paceibacterota bacterium]
MSKIVTSGKYLNIDSMHSSLLMLSGIATAFILFFLIKGENLNIQLKLSGLVLLLLIFAYIYSCLVQAGIKITVPVLFFGVMQGFLWGMGMIFTFLAFSGGADASKLVPIYNTNTLVSVFLGLMFLHELPAPDERLKVVSGAILIVIGSILVSR